MFARWRAAGLIVPSLMTLVMLPVLIGLGTWQMNRKVWKEDLIAKIASRPKAEPVSLKEVWEQFQKTGEAEYVRVRVRGTFSHKSERHLYAPTEVTQGWKKRRLAELGLSLPEELEFVECDFETTSVSSALQSASFQPKEPAIVSWMGVVYYLEKETVSRALAELAELLAPGSAVVLDYQFPTETLPQRYRDIFEQQSAFLKRAGEPQMNRYLPDELRSEILSAGFARAELPSREELHRRYFAPLASKIPMSERFGMAIAWRGERADGKGAR